ncbi:MAG: prepilin peptidase [Clostridiaceae bacterium]
MWLKYIEIIGLVAISLFTDIRYYKVKNKVVISFIFIGIITNILLYGLAGLKISIIGMFTPFVILFLLFTLRMIGAGDVKLFCAIGSIGGMNFVLNNLVYSFLCGGIISIFLMIIRKNFIERMKYFYNYIFKCIYGGRPGNYTDFDDVSGKDKFRFVYSIACGTVIQIIIKTIFSQSIL